MALGQFFSPSSSVVPLYHSTGASCLFCYLRCIFSAANSVSRYDTKITRICPFIVCRKINAVFLGIIRNTQIRPVAEMRSFCVLKPAVYLANVVFNVVNRKCGSIKLNYCLLLDYTVLLLPSWTHKYIWSLPHIMIIPPWNCLMSFAWHNFSGHISITRPPQPRLIDMGCAICRWIWY